MPKVDKTIKLVLQQIFSFFNRAQISLSLEASQVERGRERKLLRTGATIKPGWSGCHVHHKLSRHLLLIPSSTFFTVHLWPFL
jgi:hypothetical protein